RRVHERRERLAPPDQQPADEPADDGDSRERDRLARLAADLVHRVIDAVGHCRRDTDADARSGANADDGQVDPPAHDGQPGPPKRSGNPSLPGLRMPLGSSTVLTADSTPKAGPSASATNRERL